MSSGARRAPIGVGSELDFSSAANEHRFARESPSPLESGAHEHLQRAAPSRSQLCESRRKPFGVCITANAPTCASRFLAVRRCTTLTRERAAGASRVGLSRASHRLTACFIGAFGSSRRLLSLSAGLQATSRHRNSLTLTWREV